MSELYRATVVRVDTEGVFVEVASLGEGAEWGPLELLEIPLVVDDEVLVGTIFGAMEDMVLMGKLVSEPPDVPYLPPTNGSYVLYYENAAARTAAALTLTSGLSTWLDDEQRLDIYTDEGTPGYVSYYGAKGGVIAYPAATSLTLSVDSSAKSALSLTSTINGTNPLELFSVANVATPVQQSSVSGDTNPRFALYGDGKFQWGSGSGAVDTTLQRASAGALRVDSILAVNAAPISTAQIYVERDGLNRRGLSIKNTGTSGSQPHLYTETPTAATTAAAVLHSFMAGEANPRLIVNSQGSMLWGPGSTAFDVSLARTNSGEVTVGGSLIINSDLSVLGVGRKFFKYKTADNTRTNSATLTTDTDLAQSLAAGTYYIHARLLGIADAAADFKTNWAHNGTATAVKHVLGPGSGNTGAPTAVASMTLASGAYNTSFTYGTTGTSAFEIVETGIMTVTVGGTLGIQFAQGTAQANNFTLAAGSFLYIERIA